jgi:hypothetical protein
VAFGNEYFATENLEAVMYKNAQEQSVQDKPLETRQKVYKINKNNTPDKRLVVDFKFAAGTLGDEPRLIFVDNEYLYFSKGAGTAGAFSTTITKIKKENNSAMAYSIYGWSYVNILESKWGNITDEDKPNSTNEVYNSKKIVDGLYGEGYCDDSENKTDRTKENEVCNKTKKEKRAQAEEIFYSQLLPEIKEIRNGDSSEFLKNFSCGDFGAIIEYNPFTDPVDGGEGEYEEFYFTYKGKKNTNMEEYETSLRNIKCIQ